MISMISLILFMVVGVGMFAGYLALGVKTRRAPKVAPEPSALNAVGQMINLEGLAFTNPKRLLDDSEYRVLRSNPTLHKLAKRLRKERQELAILWVSMLLNDLKTLWRFRRFLLQRGLRVGLGEELAIIRAFVLSVVFLTVLRTSIHAFGPFAFPRMIRSAGGYVTGLTYTAAGILGRIPPAGWQEIERNWMSSAA